MPYDQLGRLLIAVGGLVLLLGVAFLLLGRSNFFGRLPGDISLTTGNITCVVPIVSMLVLSLLLTIIVNVVLRLLNR